MKPIDDPTRTAIGGLAALAVAMGIGRFVYTPILPAMLEAGEFSTSFAGLLASANFLGYLVGALLAASPRMHGNRRSAVSIALVGSVVTTAAMGVVEGDAIFILLRFAGGVASAFVLVFASSIVLDRIAVAGRPGLGALHFAGVGVGIAASALLVGALAASGTDWRGLWVASGLVAAVGAGVCIATLGGDAPPRREPPPAWNPSSEPSTRLLSLVVAYGLFGFGYVITATFLVAAVRASPEQGVSETVTWLLVGLAAIFSVAAWNRVAGRIGARSALGLACLVEGVGVLATAASSAAPAVLLGAALLGATFMGITALGLAEARRSSSNPGRAVAVMTAAFGVGQIVGPTFAGTLFEATGSLALPSVIAAGALVVAAVLVSAGPWAGRVAGVPRVDW